MVEQISLKSPTKTNIEESLPLNSIYEDGCMAAYSNFIAYKSCGSLKYLREDTLTTCTTTEKIFNIFKVENKLRITNFKHKMIVATIKNLNMCTLFKNFDAHSLEQDILDNHKYEIIKLIISYYLDVKLRYEGTSQTLNNHKTFIRKSLTKTVLFRGQ
ncbi:uncharacterized protein LOC108627613 [Ceratina calcarata]|uniref:Uncharacterized protein LOC108627613 n=1 Tax=Ceratina calcarata TaxID=156304 RepID=A0AAJ7J4D8_9HYME|nr:uncharacterized protein LOC108627613 [Ceratina calcarata]